MLNRIIGLASSLISKHTDSKHKETGTICPLARNKYMLSCFDDTSNWVTGGVGSKSDDTTNYNFGTKSLKLTSTNLGIFVASKQMPIPNLTGKLIVLKFYVDNATNLYDFQLYFDTNNSGWAKTYMAEYGNDAITTGWNLIVVPFNSLAPTGNPNPDNITAMKLRIQSTSGQTLNISFDAAYCVDDQTNKPKIIITFDDGDANVADIAKPYMDKYGFPGVAYVVTNSVGSEGYMTLTELKQLYECGWDVSSHTQDHLDLTTLSDADLKTQLRNSYKYLISNGFTRSARHIAYPGGKYNDNVVEAAKEIYVTGRTQAAGRTFLPLLNRFNITQSAIINTTSLSSLEAIVNNAIKYKGIAIFTFHDIVTSPSTTYQCSTANFEALMDYIWGLVKSGDIEVCTMSEICLLDSNLVDRRIEAAW